MQVRITAPATTANLGPGFDVLGAALSFGLVLDARTGGSSWDVSGSGLSGAPAPSPRLVLRAAEAVAGPLPDLDLRMQTDIPVGRGLGSSSAAVAAGLLLGRALTGRAAGAEQLLEAGLPLEGHPDNLAPCLLGGLVVCVPGDPVSMIRLEVSASVEPVVLVPDAMLSTARARAALPETVPHHDAVLTSGRTAGLLAVLTGATPASPDLLMSCTQDVLHQPYRASLMPETAEVVSRLRAERVAAVVSGAGPSILCLLPAGAAPPDPPHGWKALRTSWGTVGASVVEGS